MLKIDNHTLTYTNTMIYDQHVVFRSVATGFEYNSFFASAGSTTNWELEYFLYPNNAYVSTHRLENGVYVIEPLTTININEFSIINDINYHGEQLQQLIELLTYKGKTVHLDYTKHTVPAYRLSKVYDIFHTGCANPLSAYFCVDEFFSVNHPRYFHLKN